MSDCGNVQKVFVPVDESNEQPNISNAQGLGITDIAAEKIKIFAEKDKKNANDYGLRIKVVKDGCSGNSYNMELASIEEAKANGDKFFEKDGATVIVEKLSYLFVIGSELDYVETLLMSGFQINNPNVKKSCSCGSSFAV